MWNNWLLKAQTQKLTHGCGRHTVLAGSIGSTGITWITCKFPKYHLLTFLLCYLLTYLQPKSKMLEHLKISLILQSQANFRVIGVLAECALALLLYISSFRAMPKCPELSVLVKVLAGERCENMIKM